VLLALQRTHGNWYVQRVVGGIQAKLKVGEPENIQHVHEFGLGRFGCPEYLKIERTDPKYLFFPA
jgi:hypothetical protein